MLTVWTTTWSRPDMVQLLADALRATAPQPYTFRVVVQPGGLRREWRNVDDVIEGPKATTAAWIYTARMAGDGEHLHLHEDCIPMRAWSLPMLPCARTVGGGVIGSTLVAWRGPWQPFRATLPAPRARAGTMPAWWPADVRELAERGQCEVLLGGDFLHLDKSTIHHPASPYNAAKPAIVEAVCRHLVIDQPEPLTADELAAQRGWRPEAADATAATLRDEDGGAVPPGLGDMIASGLSAVGITKARAQAVARAVGLNDCGCSQRQQLANQIGAKYLGLPAGFSH